MPLLFEYKARSKYNVELEQKLQALRPIFKGEDFQTDTYFNISSGRLKLREGNIENALIHYYRKNIAGARQSNVLLYQHEPDANLKHVLSEALGIKIIVEKKRRIWFVKNVKIHFDTVSLLGEFVEVEAIDMDGNTSLEQLKKQCFEFARFFEIDEKDYVAASYSDLLLEK
jgi:predicted adenylyl cyclase CyaB